MNIVNAPPHNVHQILIKLLKQGVPGVHNAYFIRIFDVMSSKFPSNFQSRYTKTANFNLQFTAWTNYNNTIEINGSTWLSMGITLIMTLVFSKKQRSD